MSKAGTSLRASRARNTVIASGAKQSSSDAGTGLLRSARNDGFYVAAGILHGRSAPRSTEHGFTLIELMVVIAIIGLVSAAVIFNLPDPRGNLVDEAERFAARAAAVRDEAIISARETRVMVSAQGYRFERRRRGEWLAFDNKPLRPARWDETTRAGALAIMFDPTGQASDRTRLLLSRGDVRVAIDFDVDGTVRVAG